MSFSTILSTGLFKIKRTLCFAYKINNYYRIDLPFGGHLIWPIHGVARKFGKDIFNIKDVVLIFQKDPFLRRERIQS